MSISFRVRGIAKFNGIEIENQLRVIYVLETRVIQLKK